MTETHACTPPESNWAAVLYGTNDLRFETRPLAAGPRPGDVRVRVRAVGICGSDVHYLKHGRIGHFVVEAPMIIGHESAGEVVAVGSGVQGLRPGDLVALEPGIPCWTNRHCQEGRYNLDPGIRFFATPPVHGSLQNFVDHPAYLCHHLSFGMDCEQGAMCEPLSVGVHACRRASVSPGKRVLIMGAGPIGLLAMLTARAFGADTIAIADVRQEALDKAAELCAVAIFQVERGADPELQARDLKKIAAAPDGFDIVLDCAGFESTMRIALAAAMSGGKVVLVGMGQQEMQLPLGSASLREVDILGSFRYTNTYPTCIQLIASGRIDVKPLITHRFAFGKDQVLEGFAVAADSDKTGAIKVMFDLSSGPNVST